jgi:hypothetical protein
MIACVLMQRNEDVCLEPWLIWHGNLFGFANLFVIDHGSDKPAVREILARYAAVGVNVIFLAASADYRRKGDLVSAVMMQVERAGKHDLIMPLDCDEFVVMRFADGGPCADHAEIRKYLAGLTGEVFAVGENFLNMLGRPEIFFAFPYSKMFFRGGFVRVVDHGSHRCLDGTAGAATRIVYAHYHHKPFARQVATSLEKLAPFVDVNDRVALADFRGTGWHLVTHVLKEPHEYEALMTPDKFCIRWDGMAVALRNLGIDPSFCDAG